LVGIDYFANVASFGVPTKPNDEQWDELLRLRHAEYLILWYADGTDRDLARLDKLSNLKRVCVTFEVSEKAIADLHEALPNLKEFRARTIGGGWYVFDARSTPSVTIYPPVPTSTVKTSAPAK
jgi:hypothetical protein